MHAKHLMRTAVAFTAVAGVTLGTLAVSGTAAAAQQQTVVAQTESVAPLSVVNLGLTSAEARNVQRWLARQWNYTGAIDGQLGPNSWKAMQRWLKAQWGYGGAVDGIVGGGTISALQLMLKSGYGYGGSIDGVAGAGTQAAFKRFANARS
ncbi:peptidoglycan-binding domain-containing protein [Streptomyces bohaiensis]|uniref:Peptidoglycan-binding protein n=1 Tax=Streptomyces bohaiensis TaxID=1431344 RepID=A0ABX1C7Q3_9ACTN|nr:peptidoglycan-binding protein [Streptomyces bohaiensis]NJQ15182.1 peptidoglycan-binding protein [Streptomyces bohaiensis]